MTIPGIDMIVAISIVAAHGDFHRFASADGLVAYVGLNPTVRQSCSRAASRSPAATVTLSRGAGR
jgi:transposase